MELLLPACLTLVVILLSVLAPWQYGLHLLREDTACQDRQALRRHTVRAGAWLCCAVTLVFLAGWIALLVASPGA